MSERRDMSRADRLMNDPNWHHHSDACDDGEAHRWQPVSFVFESQLLDHDGRVLIRQPGLTEARVYCVCMVCRTHTYIETEWAGFYLGGPPSLESEDDEAEESEAPDSLDAAWAEAEAALPEGWFGPLVYREVEYEATAASVGYLLFDEPDVRVTAPTPAAALRALTAKLREEGR